ncbi:hypothetical protein GGE24_004953 [Bradyrhizobium centrosematis]|nr:hypothetical protein [Bradyrhizobium centrosematis]MCS3775614.1 hypothetical protein [Bradyrhizobium centrosematis]
MRDAAGELADGFDLLSLAKGLLDARAFVHFEAKLFVGLFQLSRPLDHQLLELLSGLLTGLEQGPDFILAPPRPHRGLNRAGQRDRLHWTFEQRNVSEEIDDAASPRNDSRLLPVAGEDDKRQVGPWRLVRDPLCERRRVIAEQSLFGQENRSNATLHLGNEFGQTSAIDRFQARAAKKLRRCRSVAADRGEYQNTVVPVGAHSAGPSGSTVPV